jgi:hypothetical protein
MDMDWRNPLDEFTLRFLIAQLTNDREGYIRMAREVKSLEESAGEAFMIRAEECGRILQQLRRQLERMSSVPPPPEPPPRHPLDSEPHHRKKW